jgi:hypothetical protein
MGARIKPSMQRTKPGANQEKQKQSLCGGNRPKNTGFSKTRKKGKEKKKYGEKDQQRSR